MRLVLLPLLLLAACADGRADASGRLAGKGEYYQLTSSDGGQLVAARCNAGETYTVAGVDLGPAQLGDAIASDLADHLDDGRLVFHGEIQDGELVADAVYVPLGHLPPRGELALVEGGNEQLLNVDAPGATRHDTSLLGSAGRRVFDSADRVIIAGWLDEAQPSLRHVEEIYLPAR